MLKLKFKLTPKEYIFAYLQLIFNKKVLKYTIFLYIAAVVIVFTIDEINTPHNLFFIELLITAFATLYYFLYFLFLTFIAFLLGIIINLFINRNIFRNEVEYTFSQKAIQWEGNGYKSSVERQSVKKLFENRFSFILLMKTARYSLLIIPRRVLNNKEKQDIFINLFYKKQSHFK